MIRNVKIGRFEISPYFVVFVFVLPKEQTSLRIEVRTNESSNLRDSIAQLHLETGGRQRIFLCLFAICFAFQYKDIDEIKVFKAFFQYSNDQYIQNVLLDLMQDPERSISSPM